MYWIGDSINKKLILFCIRSSGSQNEWKNVRWSVVDLGGRVGTYINQRRLDANEPHLLKSGDILGIGCPEFSSTIRGSTETFVYKVRAPKALRKANLLQRLALRQIGRGKYSKGHDFKILRELWAM